MSCRPFSLLDGQESGAEAVSGQISLEGNTRCQRCSRTPTRTKDPCSTQGTHEQNGTKRNGQKQAWRTGTSEGRMLSMPRRRHDDVAISVAHRNSGISGTFAFLSTWGKGGSQRLVLESRSSRQQDKAARQRSGKRRARRAMACSRPQR